MYLKFCKIDCYNVSNLKSNSLYAASPDKFNDPFEAMCTTEFSKSLYKTGVIQGHEQVIRYRTRRAVISLMKVSSCDEIKDNILMWSHYADSHKGFCIAYKDSIRDVLKNQSIMYRPIDYETTLCQIDENGDGYEIDPIFTKAKQWEYEKEERFLFKLEGLYSLGNRPSDSVEAIYLGCKIDVNSNCYKEIIKFALDNNIPCYQAMVSPIKYELVFEKI